MHLFDRSISLDQTAPFRFHGKISEEWLINGNANGGYLMAMLAHSVFQSGEEKSLCILTANFISRSIPGPADIVVDHIGSSKFFDRRRIRLIQDGRENIHALGTFALRNKTRGVKIWESPAPEIPPAEDCIPVPPFPNYSLYNQMDIRLTPDAAGWMSGGVLSEKSETGGWIKFKDDRPFDVQAVLLAIDSFPPAVLASQGLIAWVPTIELSVNIRNLPGSRWLKCVFRSRFIDGGVVEEDGEMWDETGELIAVSRQIAQFRKGA